MGWSPGSGHAWVSTEYLLWTDPLPEAIWVMFTFQMGQRLGAEALVNQTPGFSQPRGLQAGVCPSQGRRKSWEWSVRSHSM